MASDKQPTLTAAELREIGERVREYASETCTDNSCGCCTVFRDHARLYDALTGLIDVSMTEVAGKWCIAGMPGDLVWYDTKDDAIDALLAQGGA